MGNRKGPRAKARPPLRLAGDPGDATTEWLGQIRAAGTWDAFTVPLPHSNVVYYPAPAAALDSPAAEPVPETEPDPEWEPDPELEEMDPLFPEATGQGWGTDTLCAETVQGWGNITVIRCAGTRCVAAWQDPHAPSYRALYEGARQAGWRRSSLGTDYCGRCARLSGEFWPTGPVVPWGYSDEQLRDRTLSHWAASHARAGAHRAGVAR